MIYRICILIPSEIGIPPRKHCCSSINGRIRCLFQLEATFTQKSENALEVVMWIGAVYPDRAIKMLVGAAAKTNGNQAKMLLVAASKALAMWECERVRPECENVAIPK